MTQIKNWTETENYKILHEN